MTGINFDLYENILRNVKYSLNSTGIVTFLYSNDMHTHGTDDNCLSFEQWSEDFFSNKLKLWDLTIKSLIRKVGKYQLLFVIVGILKKMILNLLYLSNYEFFTIFK